MFYSQKCNILHIRGGLEMKSNVFFEGGGDERNISCRADSNHFYWFLHDALICFFELFIKTMESRQKCVFCFCLLPGRRLLLTPGMGMGGGK